MSDDQFLEKDLCMLFRNDLLNKAVCIGLLAAFVSITAVRADNQIIAKNIGTSDPAPNVFNGTLYLYCTEDMVGNGNLDISVIHCYSTTDLYHWKDEGEVLKEADIPWCSKAKRLWAPHCVYFGGKYHLYVPETDKNDIFRIAHTTATSPTGPFTGDANFMSGCGVDAIDPYVVIDSGSGGSGKNYICWDQVNTTPNFVAIRQLTADLSDATGTQTDLSAGMGPSQSTYKEGVWFVKYNNVWNFFYADWVQGSVGREEIGLSTSSTLIPAAGQKYNWQKFVMTQNTGTSATSHAGICYYKNRWIMFYHCDGSEWGGSLTTGLKRVTGAGYFDFNPDGSVPLIPKTYRGIGAPEGNDTIQIDRRSAISGAGISVVGGGEPVGYMVSGIANNGWIRYDTVHFAGGGPGGVSVRVAAASAGGSIEFRFGSNTGKLLGTAAIAGTGGLTKWQTQAATGWTSVASDSGIQNLVLVFKTISANQFNVNWVKFDSPATEARNSGVSDVLSPGLSYRRLNKNTFQIGAGVGVSVPKVKLFGLNGREIVRAVQMNVSEQRIVTVCLKADCLSSGTYILSVTSGEGGCIFPFVY
jgi:arabinoxylan arabinofuranohydrolase